MEDLEKIIHETITGCSGKVSKIFDQPTMPDEIKCNLAIDLIKKQISGLPPEIQTMLLSAAMITAIAPYLMNKKCSGCRSKIYEPEKEDRRLGYMYV